MDLDQIILEELVESEYELCSCVVCGVADLGLSRC